VVERLIRLRDALAQSPCTYTDLVAVLPAYYRADETSRRQFRRDLESLESLGYRVRRYDGPRRWAVESAGSLSDKSVETLTYIRAAFPEQHPLAPRVQALLGALTAHLTPAQQRLWEREPPWRLALQPVIDYSPTAPLIAWLDDAIRQRRQIALLYRAQGRPEPLLHPRLDPYDLEYSDHHFYLSAYSYRFGSVLSFRIDRIVSDPERSSPTLLADMQQPRRERPEIHFTYRLSAAIAEGGVSERFTIRAVQRDGDGVVVRASDTSEFRIVRVLLAYGEKATLLDGPPSLLERMRKTVALMAAAYRT
jgi:predicted DNA-binding transcriptional regulator YafY